MNVLEKFIELTKFTYPHGTEQQLFDKLPSFLNTDSFGNLYYQIGSNPSTMFTCHLDTASYNQDEVHHVINGDIITSDGSTILGADDKAGVVVLLSLIEGNVEGLYYFFLGEERGCIGSKDLASLHKSQPMNNITKVVSFDRRGKDSVITHQLSGRCCSEDFALELSKQLNEVSSKILSEPFKYKPDPTGIYTDSAQFTTIYSECTNISVGYQNEHTKWESQDIKHLNDLCEVVKRINWELLPTTRSPKIKDWDYDDDYFGYSYGYGSSYSSYLKDYDYEYFEKEVIKPTSKTVSIFDYENFGYETLVQYDTLSHEILEVKLHPNRVKEETKRIKSLLNDLEVEYDQISWDGNRLVINNLADKDCILTRKDIEDYISSLNDWIDTEIKYNSIGI